MKTNVLEYSCPSLIHVRMVGELKFREMFLLHAFHRYKREPDVNKIYSRATTEHKKREKEATAWFIFLKQCDRT